MTDCAAIRTGTYFTQSMTAIQPVDPTLPLRYDRTLSLHNYIIVRFELITSGWNQGSHMLINLYNQIGAPIITESRMDYLPNVPK